ncbi:MAG: ACP S-malonyltransferase [Burkholderiales bacterium]|nr:ACP S-malonyltransferase [Burkholderiales bacterium]
MKLAFVFPGQGSQAVGMLQGYAGLAGVDEVRAEAQATLGAEFLRVLDEGPADALALTVNTQPAMVTAGIAAFRAWTALGGAAPSVVAGHSLGEYTALVAAGALTLEACLPLVRVRAEAMQQAVPEGVGAMAAIMSLDDDAVRAACADAGQGEVVQAVNFNAPGQVVIAGHKAAVERAIAACKARGAKRAMVLPVSAPFHSSLMQPAAERLREALGRVPIAPPQIDLINNVDVAVQRSPDAVKDALVRQAASPVRWAETVRAMAQRGVTHIVECGPGKVLAGLVKRIVPDVQGVALADGASLEQALAAMREA